MSRYWSELVRRLEPYVPGEQPREAGLVKLNTNENPFGPSPRVLEAIRDRAGDNLRLYPPPDARQLKCVVAAYHGVSEKNVFAGNGSDEVLAHAFQAFFSGVGTIRFPDITYSFYPVYCGLYDIPFRAVPLREDFSVRPADYRGAAGIVLANPNAPTGIVLDPESVESLVRDNPDAVVIVDEAYVDFGAESAIPLVRRYPNLLVVQTLSKSRSLAGLRVGFAIGDEALVEALERVKNSFNSYPLDQLAIAGAVASFEDESYFQQTRGAVIAERESLFAALVERGFRVLPSATNFLLAEHPRVPGGDLAAGLRRRGIVVRHFGKARIENFLRITVGTADQHGRLLEALDAILPR